MAAGLKSQHLKIGSLMKLLLLAATVCLMVVTGLMKGDVDMNDEESLTTWGPIIEGCRFSIVADHDSYPVGEPIRLRMRIENVGDEVVYLLGSQYDIWQTDGFRFDVRMPNGPVLLSESESKPLPLTREGKRRRELPSSGFSPPFNPGESAATSVAMLNRIYDMSVRGEYSVTVYWQISLPQSGDKDQPIEVKSNTLKIIVRERKEEEEE